MRWSPWILTQVARRAGWVGDELVDAVALALATSGGEDAFRYVVDPGPLVDQRGVWGIDVARIPEWASADLVDLDVNAAAAHSLYVVAGDSFDWSPVWRAGIKDQTREQALEAVTSAVETQSEQNPVAVMTQGSGAGAALTARRGVEALLAQPVPVAG